MPRRLRVSWVGALLLTVFVLAAAVTDSLAQQTYPTKSIAWVVTFAAGGGGDVVARVIAKHLTKELGQPVNIVNKPGGNSIPGVLSVLNSAPDGYNLLFMGSAQSSLQALQKNLPYKLDEQTWTWGPFTNRGPYVYAVNAKAPWKTLKDFVEAARKNPESIRMGWLGGSSGTDFTLLRFLDVAGIDAKKVRKVPFTGSGPSMTALAGGHIDLSGGLASAAFALLASGDVRLLAITGDQRFRTLPDVPSSKEAGFHVSFTGWNGITAPKGLPKEVLNRIDQAVKKIMQDPEYAKDLEAVGHLPMYEPPDKMWPLIKEEIDEFQKLQA